MDGDPLFFCFVVGDGLFFFEENGKGYPCLSYRVIFLGCGMHV